MHAKMNMDLLGDQAIVFLWPQVHASEDVIKPADIAARAARLQKLGITGVKACVPASRSVVFHLDLQALIGSRDAAEHIHDRLEAFVDQLVREWQVEPDAKREDDDGSIVRLPVVYGDADGPDLTDCATRSGMSEEDFIQAHAGAIYEVDMIGFAPGFPYMSGLPAALTQPRREHPRLAVPAGAIGIAGAYTGVYPVPSPGGWQWIGRTPVKLFRPEDDEPFLLKAGDRVVFEPVSGDAEAVETAEAIGASRPLTVADGARTLHDAIESAVETSDTPDALAVLKPGMWTTVQDHGRYGWQTYGVSVSGAMDIVSLRAGNALVGNDEQAAVLELTAVGGEFRAIRDLLIAVCGADLSARIDGEALPLDRPVWLRAGAELTFGHAVRGCRAYLAVAGGWATPRMLGSRSTDVRLGATHTGGRALVAGDRLPAGTPSAVAKRMAAMLAMRAGRLGRSWAACAWRANLHRRTGSAVAGNVSSSLIELRVLKGAQWEEFTAAGRAHLLHEPFQVSADSNRMGIRLRGPSIVRESSVQLDSRGIVPGTIQVPPDGQPIILAADCQPTGGYPVIAHVILADLPLLAQCKPGDAIVFRQADHEEAWQAWQQTQRHYRLMLAGIRLAERMESN